MSFILVTEKNNSVHITLNRPEALNAINHHMVLEITNILDRYQNSKHIESIVFKGIGDKAFCAGGDIKSAYYGGKKDPHIAWKYFKDEYAMNAMIYSYPKPIISLCHGYVMGGGYGIAGNGKFVVACENTKFAMPETGIGFFPDVGIGWKLAKAGGIGMYIALTGSVFDADMMMASGLATHKTSFKNLSSFSSLENLETVKTNEILNRDEIETIFSLPSLKDIWEALEQSDTLFSTSTLEILKMRSPISLHVTFRHIQMAAKQDYYTAIERDYKLACAMFTRPDVYEGIRAAIIDKDKKPTWESSSIFNISQAHIDYYFKFIDDC